MPTAEGPVTGRSRFDEDRGPGGRHADNEAVSIPSSPAAASRRAVVVDDEQALARLVAGYLERDGFEIHVTHDGAQAVGVLRAVDPDVVVLDLGLPGLDGVEVCRQLRTFSDCYVIMLTARAEEVDTLIGLSVGADDYMTKPFSPRELMARVGVLLRRPRGRCGRTAAARGCRRASGARAGRGRRPGARPPPSSVPTPPRSVPVG